MWTFCSRGLWTHLSRGLKGFPTKLKASGCITGNSFCGVYFGSALNYECPSRPSCKLLPAHCRGLANGCGTDHSAQKKKKKMLTGLDQFDEVFPELVDLLVKDELNDPERTDASKWFKEVLEYNVPFGQKYGGMFVVMAYKYLAKQPKEEDIKIARILGWCVELSYAFFQVEDDIMDQSYTRLRQLCWFRKANVGLKAVNDSVYIESCIYKILKHYIRDKPYYINIIELFHENILCTITGQCLDMTVSPPSGEVDFSRYTMDKYNAIAKWKTAFGSFYLPVATAMYMAGIADEYNHKCAKDILLKMGETYQVQDDNLDCYGDEALTGKTGTDIQDNKCSWLVVKALQKATPEQLVLLKENYGSSEETKVAKVKALYEELELEQEFKDFEEESFQEILELIKKHSGDLPKDMFKAFVQSIYNRNR